MNYRDLYLAHLGARLLGLPDEERLAGQMEAIIYDNEDLARQDGAEVDDVVEAFNTFSDRLATQAPDLLRQDTIHLKQFVTVDALGETREHSYGVALRFELVEDDFTLDMHAGKEVTQEMAKRGLLYAEVPVSLVLHLPEEKKES